MASASDKNKHKEKILETPDAPYQGLEDCHHGQNEALDSDPSMFQQTVQAPSASTTKFPITQNHHFGGGGECGKTVLYVTDPKSIRPRSELPLSHFTNSQGSRVTWTKELHERLFEVISELGGLSKVIPSTLRQTMAVKGLTEAHLSSRLQKIRSGKITKTNWRESQNSKNFSRKNSPLQGGLRPQQLQDLEDDLNADDYEDPVSPTSQKALFDMCNSFEECIRRPETIPAPLLIVIHQIRGRFD